MGWYWRNRSQVLMFRVSSKNVVMSALMQCGGLRERWRFRQEYTRRGIMTAEEYRKYLEQDFCDVNIDEMTDLLTIKADRNKSLKERRESYLNKVGNPYLVRIGNMKVKVRFANNGISLEQAFENMLLSI